MTHSFFKEPRIPMEMYTGPIRHPVVTITPEPKISLEESLDEVIDWMRQNMEKKNEISSKTI